MTPFCSFLLFFCGTWEQFADTAVLQRHQVVLPTNWVSKVLGRNTSANLLQHGNLLWVWITGQLFDVLWKKKGVAATYWEEIYCQSQPSPFQECFWPSRHAHQHCGGRITTPKHAQLDAIVPVDPLQYSLGARGRVCTKTYTVLLLVGEHCLISLVHALTHARIQNRIFLHALGRLN